MMRGPLDVIRRMAVPVLVGMVMWWGIIAALRWAV